MRELAHKDRIEMINLSKNIYNKNNNKYNRTAIKNSIK
jgi:hypothetical protein